MTKGPTTKDLWDVSNRIEEKLDRKLEAIEHRLYSLESYQNRAAGIVTVIALFASAIAAWVWTKIIGS